MPCLYCRKMCCLNGSRKLHFVQKIRLDRIIKYLRPDVFFARSAIFCRYWTCSFSCRNNQAIGAEVVCIFSFFISHICLQNGNGRSATLFIFVFRGAKVRQKRQSVVTRIASKVFNITESVIFDDIRREICPTSSSHIAKNERCFRSSSGRKSRSASCSCR